MSELRGKPALKSHTKDREAQKKVARKKPTTLGSGNLKIARTFTDRERDTFLREGYNHIAKFFKASLSKLKSKNRNIDYDFDRVDSRRFVAIVYRNGRAQTQCTIRLDRTFNGITYLGGEDRASSGSTFNHLLSLADDSYSLFFKAGFGGSYDSKDQHLTFPHAAEYLWAFFMQPLQQR